MLGPFSDVDGLGHLKSLEPKKEMENLDAFPIFIILLEDFPRTHK